MPEREGRSGAQGPSREPRKLSVSRVGETSNVPPGIKRRGLIGIWKRRSENRAKRKAEAERKKQALRDVIFGLERMGQIDQVGATSPAARRKILDDLLAAARARGLDATRRQVAKEWGAFKEALAKDHGSKRIYRHDQDQ